MQSPLRPRNVIIFVLINIFISAVTAFIVVRALTLSANLPASAVPASAAAAAPTAAPQPAAPQEALVPTAEAADANLLAPTTEPAQPVATPAAADAAGAAGPAAAPGEPTAAGEGQAAQPGAQAVATESGRAEPANVRISTIVYPGQRTREAVVIVNEGDQVNMTGWTLTSPSGQTYTFGNVLLFKDSFINLHTTTGVDVPTDLFWNLDQPVWKTGDIATLKRGEDVMATFTVK